MSVVPGTTLARAWITISTLSDGVPGPAGVDANLLDWVADWNTAKTVINSNSVITPKIFAGVKNANNTLTGVALGRFSMSTRNDAGVIITETIDGIYGFRDGYKTFFIDSGGNAQLGRGNQSIKYNAVTGKVEFGSEVALAWVGATYIDASGIFTGTLSANTVNAIRINASQISAGTIDASRIDTAALKATLITAGNIEALALNVTKGKIGGWSIDADSIYLGTNNNTSGAYTAASGAMTIGSTGIRGYKWRLDSTGAGAVAGGNIAWDAAGVITFAASVSLNWTTPINNINTALGGTSFPKLTQISSTGIYTGSITAEQITAGTISADRIAAGSINSTKLDAASIKANIINVGYINGLSCAFVQGTIGGWTINSGSISGGQIILDKTNNRIAVFGASSSSIAGHRTMLYYTSNSDFGLHSTDSAGNTLVRLGSVNQIAGWNLNASQIYKNSVYLGADGSIANAGKWSLNNDGSGSLASGNISWNAVGAVTFSAAVSLSWTTPIDNINTALGGTSFPKLTYISSTGIYTGILTANQVNAVSINASSIITGTLSADRIATGSINATKLDAASIKSDIINTTYINGLSCAFVRGTIGGFTIGSDNMSVGSIGGIGQTPIQIRSISTGSGYWYTGAYKPFGVTMTWFQTNNAGHITLGQVAASGSTVKTGFIGIQMMAWDNTEYFCLSANSLLSGSKEVYNRIAGWAFDNQNIWKNSVYLGSDGSIYNGTKWRFNNDGSGQIANGNIYWNAAGTVTFSASVSLNWSNLINSGRLYARGSGLNNSVNRIVSLNGSNIIDNGSRGLTLTIINRNTLTHISSTNYDVYGSDVSCNTMASALDVLSSDKIVIITSYDAIRINQILNTALQRCGGRDWTVYDERVPYVLIGIPNIGKGNGLISVFTTSASDPFAEVSTTIQDGIPLGVNTNGKIYTFIDGNGIYTGSITASQIIAGTIDAARINTDSIRAAIITAANINALTLTIDKGYIGGWSINSYQISKNSVALTSDGSIVNGTRWKLNNDGSGLLANGNISWDTAGNITARGAVFNNVRIQGSVRNPFVLNDSSIWIGGDSSNQQNFSTYDNIVAVRGSWDEYINLPWTLANSGRRVTLVNYKWGSNVTQGYMSISAPSGKYFFEDGLQKSSITFSREIIELLGYGDNSTFFGWIVINRRDIMTSGRYGSYLQVLASGQVTVNGTSVSMKQLTYDGGSMSISRTGVGRYTVYLPWSLNSNYIVQMTGYYTNTPIYATIMGIYSSYFYVQTQDDPSANEGSFCFQVFSTANWT